MIRGSGVDTAAAHIYRRLWEVLVHLFHVPETPPTLPTRPGEELAVFQPSPSYLRYQKLRFWLLLLLIDVPLLVLWAFTIISIWWLGLLLAPIFLVLIIGPDIVAYVAIHLHYDTMWYALSDRSMRIRRGIWVIHEQTITFENIQNLTLRQGPLERCFGIARLIVHTAGGGDESSPGESPGHTGRIEGVDNASVIRDLILSRVRGTRPPGPVDDRQVATATGSDWLWSTSHLEVLRSLRDVALAREPGSLPGRSGP